MADLDMNKLRILAESAERRAKELHLKYRAAIEADPADLGVARGYLNDFFYWSGKATSYRGIVSMLELQTVIEEEMDNEPSCP